MEENRKRTFRELLRASFKSDDTEEWLDIYFTRPIGLAFALVCQRLGVHPNAITILGIVLGMAAAYMFYFEDLAHNVAGIALLMLANFCDSADGQLARLANKKTLFGRVIDGFSGDIWFFCIYLAICLRTMPHYIPGTDMRWGLWIFLLAAIAGFVAHTPQASLADYYRQVHLFFLKGKGGSELDNYASQRAIYDSLPARQWFACLFYYNYANYCKSQERRTPKFQAFMRRLGESGIDASERQRLRDEFLAGSRPLMPYTNILSFNTRAISIYVTCLLGCPWVYMLMDLTFFSFLFVRMRHRHEKLCERLSGKYLRKD